MKKDLQLIAEAYEQILNEYRGDIQKVIMKEMDAILSSGADPENIPGILVNNINKKIGNDAAKASIKWMQLHGWKNIPPMPKPIESKSNEEPTEIDYKDFGSEDDQDDNLQST